MIKIKISKEQKENQAVKVLKNKDEEMQSDFCSGCGWCCEAFSLHHPMKYYKQKLRWYKIYSRRSTIDSLPQENIDFYNELLIITKHMHQRKESDKKLYIKNKRRGQYPFTCDLLDKETRQCKNYENRPLFCKKYICKNPKKASEDMKEILICRKIEQGL